MGSAGSAPCRVLLAAAFAISLWLGLPVHQVSATEGAVRVPILAYHGVDYSGSPFSVTPVQLEEQLIWLTAQGYTAITLGQLWDAAQGYGALPPMPVVLTNDDGWTTAITFADILGRYGMVGTYFINNTSPLTADQILYLAQRGSVEAHTESHVSLRGLDYESQYAEIANNKAYIEQITGVPVRFLAWPFGDCDDSAVMAAQAAGIVAAVGLDGTSALLGSLDPYYIPRIMMGATNDLVTFSEMVQLW